MDYYVISVDQLEDTHPLTILVVIQVICTYDVTCYNILGDIIEFDLWLLYHPLRTDYKVSLSQ